MKGLFTPNISRNGRLVRAVIATLLLIAGIFAGELHPVARVALLGAGLFLAFEAMRGWCALRACGIKIRL